MTRDELKTFLLELEGALEQAHADALRAEREAECSGMQPDGVDWIDWSAAVTDLERRAERAAERCRTVCDLYGVDWQSTRPGLPKNLAEDLRKSPVRQRVAKLMEPK